jgi:hypothetical protein
MRANGLFRTILKTNQLLHAKFCPGRRFRVYARMSTSWRIARPGGAQRVPWHVWRTPWMDKRLGLSGLRRIGTEMDAMAKKKHAGTENLRAMRERQSAEDRPPALSHGINSFLAHGRLPDAVRERLDAFQSGVISDLGGADNVTMAQRTLVESSQLCFGVVLLGNAWIAQNGAVQPNGKPVYILNVLAAYLNTLRLNLMALGLERRTKTAQTLDDYIRSNNATAVNP